VSLKQSLKKRHEAVLEAVEEILEAAEKAHDLVNAILLVERPSTGYPFSAKGHISDIIRICKEILNKG